MTILEKNIQALLSGVNEPLGNKLLNFIQNKTCSRFNIDENLNIYDKTHNVFMYENLEEELNFFYQSILEKTHRYPFVCIYGIGNALLIKNLSKHYKHLFVFESEIELFILALSTIDLSEELCSGKIYLVDVCEPKMELQLSILFDQKDMFEWLNLYEMFISCNFYKMYYQDVILKTDQTCMDNIFVVIRNFDPNDQLTTICYKQFLQNIPHLLQNIPFQRLLSERKAKFDTAVVVSAGPSLHKQLALLRQYQENVVIFCADGALNMLENEGIVADYVLNLDIEDLAVKFFNCSKSLDYSKTIAVLAVNTHPNVIDCLINKFPYCIALRDEYLYKQFHLDDFGYIDTGTHVSHFSYTLALALGFKNIIMIGQDLAFDKDGNSHSKGFAFGENSNAEKNFQLLQVPSYYKDGNKVTTHVSWNDYRIKLEYLIARNSEINFYNATEGGAYINFAKNTSFKECCEKFFTQKKPCFDIPKTFTYNRSLKFLSKVFLHLKNDLQNAQDILRDAHLLNNVLIGVVNIKNPLPLDFLQNIYKSIGDFNSVLDDDKFIQDGILKGVLYYRGSFLSEAIKKDLKDEAYYLLNFISAYQKWLEKFIERLEIKNAIIKDTVLKYGNLI
ncbi:motility associated factor glycosyltransferase family protein [Campylobacter coli]|nr:motility associated factor glycosyltransferase family protein [Campylobacter coli]MCE7156946.1 motility associated factor glycosyltransferase family protein [Campylobacter coli]